MLTYDQVQTAYDNHDGTWEDLAHQLTLIENLGEVKMPFGKFQGMKLSQVEPSYMQWFLTLTNADANLQAQVYRYMSVTYPLLVTNTAIEMKKIQTQEWEARKNGTTTPPPAAPDSPSFTPVKSSVRDATGFTFPSPPSWN